jgi:hypothetical protein
MLSIAPEALGYIQTKDKPIFLDMPPIIGCCIHLRECPSVRFGEPFDAENYDKQVIQGTVVFVPHELPKIDLTITLTSFLGFKKLAVEGWHLA